MSPQLESKFHPAGEHVRPTPETPVAKGHQPLTGRKEERDVGAYNSWVADPVVKIIGEFEASLQEVKLGTPDPYTPPEPTR